MYNYNELIEKLETKKDFIELVHLLIADFRSKQSEWTNDNLLDYLTGIASWTEDSDGYFENMKLGQPKDVDWKMLAMVLVAAKIYE